MPANESAFGLLQIPARFDMPITEQINWQAGHAGRYPCSLQL